MGELLRLSALSAFAGLTPSPSPDAKVQVVDLDGRGIATVIVRNGQRLALGTRLRKARGLKLESGARLSEGGGLTFAGIGPDSWLAFGENLAGDFAEDLRATVQDAASVIDQSSGYGVLHLCGDEVETCLSRIVPLDLHASVFRPGSVASTVIAHVPVILWRTETAFEIAVFRSYASSLMHELASAARPFGFGARTARG